MHWLIPFAGAWSPAAAQAADGLALPNLERLLARLAPVPEAPGDRTADREADDGLSLTPPHERALAEAWGWPAQPDGLLPMAAAAARADGLPVADDGRGWALLSPTHWHLGTEQVSLADPDELALGEAEARTLFEALAPLFADEGLPLQWGAPTRWYLAHERLATLPSASLDRVVGRNVDRWLNPHPDARLFRRLQAEAQMLLHTHPLNAEREAAGRLAVNSFWLSGTGRPLPPPSREAGALAVIESLRRPALAEDWAAWAEAFAAVDAGPLAEARSAAEAGRPLRLTLCGERRARRFEPAPRSLLKRWFGAGQQPAAPVLKAL